MKIKLFLLTSLLTTSLAIGQTRTEETQTPLKIKVYTPTGLSTSGTTKDNSYKWVVKTDLLGFVSGEFPVIAEYRFSKKLSAEASAGLTYAYIANNFTLSGENDDDYGETKAAMGTAFRAAIKYYPSSDYDAIEGWSFGIQVFSKTNNREYQTEEKSYTTTPSVLEGKKDIKTKTGISLVIGKQIFQDSNIAFESFIGIGFANVTRERFVNVDDYDSNGKYLGLAIKPLKTTETLPNIQLGLRIGFGN
ncbi:DUF3575 domain-containing protein [Flavobacterium crassostreae]|uniref:Outer membrane protein beta-barrel domain-containing protein n=1 Tax=Flavobacterium crassostreae TaxID=1763534 RepID=A0A1B9E4J4_9FLAO|nr:DUF3575 domain-containing protein [Flavobacterium crassostreae]OCB76874.1 hypothetical protein LPBF_05525 [Flavobacterium crassostreae]